MKTIIVSDIFGLTPHLERFVKELTSDYEIIDPYNGQMVRFRSESEAYKTFLHLCGMERYSDLVGRRVADYKENIVLLGFSIGGSAVWNNLEICDPQIVQKAVCFYGSRIREKIELQPCCDTVLIFPKEESHFSVPELSSLLAAKPHVKCINTEFYHGFMNRLSVNFNQRGYIQYLGWLKQNCLNALSPAECKNSHP